jgi:hypothetical protein
LTEIAAVGMGLRAAVLAARAGDPTAEPVA